MEEKKTTVCITVCVNKRSNPDQPSCGARGGIELADALEAAVAERKLSVEIERFYCLGCCSEGPNVKFSPGGEFWHDMKIADLPRLLDRIAAFAQDCADNSRTDQ